MALDLGRYKSVVCLDQRDTRAATFRTIDTTPEIVRELCAEQPAALVVVEACANAGWVHDVAVACGLSVKVANTAGEAWKFTHLKRKTDKDDALRLAELEMLGQLPTVHLPAPTVRQRRALIATRQELVGRRVACQNRLRALFAGQGWPTPHGAKAWTEVGLAGIGQHARPLKECAVECAWCMLRYNAWARRVYRQLTGGGLTRKKPAIVALARKLLVRCWAMLRDGVPWRAEPDVEPLAA